MNTAWTRAKVRGKVESRIVNRRFKSIVRSNYGSRIPGVRFQVVSDRSNGYTQRFLRTAVDTGRFKSTISANRAIRAVSPSFRRKQNLKIGLGLAAAGTVAYGATDRVGKRSKSKTVNGYRKAAHGSARALAVPGHAAWGAGHTFARTGSPTLALSSGSSRGVQSALGTNPITRRRTTMHAKQVRVQMAQTKRAQQASEIRSGPLSPAQRSANARKAVKKRRRDSRGRLR
jgi:hypothetical protein